LGLQLSVAFATLGGPAATLGGLSATFVRGFHREVSASAFDRM